MRQIERARGFVHDIDHIKTLSVSPQNARILSDRVLYVLQNLALEDITFYSRYGVISGSTYEPVDPMSADGQVVADVVSLARDELNTMTLEQTLECICSKLDALAVISSQDCGTDIDPDGAETPPVPGPDFPNQPTYDTYKCKAANWLQDGLEDIISKFALYDVDFWTTTTFSVLVGLVSALILASIFTGFVGVIAGAIILIATRLVTGASVLDLSDISSVLVANRADFICAFYTGVDETESRSNFEAVASANGLSVLEVELLSLILTNNTLNGLFDFREVIDDYTATTSCAGCCASVHIQKGTLTDVSGDQYTIASEQISGGDWFVEFYVNVEPEDFPADECGPQMDLELTSITGFTDPPVGDDNFIVYDDPAYNELFSLNGVPTVPTTWTPARGIWSKSATEWTMIVKINQL